MSDRHYCINGKIYKCNDPISRFNLLDHTLLRLEKILLISVITVPVYKEAVIQIRSIYMHLVNMSENVS